MFGHDELAVFWVIQFNCSSMGVAVYQSGGYYQNMAKNALGPSSRPASQPASPPTWVVLVSINISFSGD